MGAPAVADVDDIYSVTVDSEKNSVNMWLPPVKDLADFKWVARAFGR